MGWLLEQTMNEGVASWIGDPTRATGGGPYVTWFAQKYKRNLDRLAQNTALFDTLLFRLWNDPSAPRDVLNPIGFSGGWDTGVFERNGLRINIGGREVDPAAIDWSRVDIRSLNIYQPPGPDNVLGTVKFLFPNKHDVYMHDTPDRHLFGSVPRAFSHGCMRTQNPIHLAEVLLAHDKGYSVAQVNDKYINHNKNIQIFIIQQTSREIFFCDYKHRIHSIIHSQYYCVIHLYTKFRHIFWWMRNILFVDIYIISCNKNIFIFFNINTVP